MLCKQAGEHTEDKQKEHASAHNKQKKSTNAHQGRDHPCTQKRKDHRQEENMNTYTRMHTTSKSERVPLLFFSKVRRTGSTGTGDRRRGTKHRRKIKRGEGERKREHLIVPYVLGGRVEILFLDTQNDLHAASAATGSQRMGEKQEEEEEKKKRKKKRRRGRRNKEEEERGKKEKEEKRKRRRGRSQERERRGGGQVRTSSDLTASTVYTVDVRTASTKVRTWGRIPIESISSSLAARERQREGRRKRLEGEQEEKRGETAV